MNNYIQIENQLKEQFSELKSRKNLLSNIRLAAFVMTCVLFYFYVSHDNILLLLATGILFIIFMIFVVKSTNVSNKIAHISQSLLIIEDIKTNDRVDEYVAINDEHFANVYNKDLDILEGQSLFNRLNKTQSYIGNVQLKYFLSNLIFEKEEILNRQKALEELKNKPDWIVKFLTFSSKANLKSFEIFGTLNRQFENQNLRFLPIVLGVINLAIFIYLAVLGFPKKAVFFWIVIAIPVGFIINFLFKNRINKSLSFAFISPEQLDHLIELLIHTENEDFKEEINLNNKNGLFNDGVKASDQLKGIKSSMDGFSALGIPIAGFLLNCFTLWKLYHTIQLEGRVGSAIKNNQDWIVKLSAIEAYISFAIFNDKFNTFSTPIISDQPFELSLKNAFHPLLSEDIAVKNEFQSNRRNNIAIITGANMAGKSTFLRTVGTNLVLAMNGANVSAAEMVFYPMDIFTSIRTVDNLSSGDSYFKNEINKLKILIDRLEEGKPQYIILDEILKGTNSQDKLIGSQKFLEKLMKSKTNLTCFIATHDLELTKMESDFPDHIINYCFELKNVDENYFSDYKLRKGTTQMMNAIYLLKQYKIID
ncbi:MutS-related protein [Faecalibacter bovis]|uniref:DNA mismatch repair proteins mutS family domain-containing protein n=1 Tax=Faecalibacter bovis TaxID=2898187 RepID=A0ABX7XAF4_9FLAO|nr:hypothetical protein [Faecalibacter bovis]QTV04876.1 hypothetical protein J9309_08705 [Faecalibacter bovis]